MSSTLRVRHLSRLMYGGVSLLYDMQRNLIDGFPSQESLMHGTSSGLEADILDLFRMGMSMRQNGVMITSVTQH